MLDGTAVRAEPQFFSGKYLGKSVPKKNVALRNDPSGLVIGVIMSYKLRITVCWHCYVENLIDNYTC